MVNVKKQGLLVRSVGFFRTTSLTLDACYSNRLMCVNSKLCLHFSLELYFLEQDTYFCFSNAFQWIRHSSSVVPASINTTVDRSEQDCFEKYIVNALNEKKKHVTLRSKIINKKTFSIIWIDKCV